jgi:lipopolysaccharide transport system ATP-binding protein
MPDSDIIITAEKLSKVYRIWEKPSAHLKSSLLAGIANVFPKRSAPHRALNARAARGWSDFYALRDVSFTVRRGMSFGIIGRNGSGKSTLLQLIAGTLTPSSGTVSTRGRVAALLELGSGFNPDFTGRENVFLNGVILGISQQEMERRFDEIAAFADIGSFIDQPLKTYSSGMMVRLAFAVATAVKPDIFIVDEALSVGDVFFQQKCFKRIHRLLDEGTALLFVSHDTASVQNLCDHAILLHKGSVFYQGLPEECASRYFTLSGEKDAIPDGEIMTGPVSNSALAKGPDDVFSNNLLSTARARHGSRGMEVQAIAFFNEHGLPVPHVKMGQTGHLHVVVIANEEVPVPAVGIRVHDRMSNLVFAAGNRQLQQKLPALAPGAGLHLQFDLGFNVNPGLFTLTVDCSVPSTEGPNHGVFQDVVEGLGPIQVYCEANRMWPFYGVAQLPLSVSYNKFPSPQQTEAGEKLQTSLAADPTREGT